MIAPTGTIGLVMDCDTTGIEPDFALVKFKSLQAVVISKSSTVLSHLHWPNWGMAAQVEEIASYAVGHGTIGNAPVINHTSLIGMDLARRVG